MSEIKRVPLIPFTAQKVEDKKGKEAGKTVRISLILPESNEDTCPDYNYKEELAAAKKKEKLKHIPIKPTTNGLDPFNEDDDDVRRIAQEMEAKYGCSPKKKRKGRRDDYADIGMGYDESDSFIDNTDGYDEMIPQKVTTLLGGFYINCGALEFKTDDEASSEVSSSSSDEDAPEKNTTSRKRILDTSSESEGDKETEKIVNINKKPKLETNGMSTIPNLMKKKYLDPHKIKQLKRKRSEEKKKAATVKELLQERREDDVNMVSENTFENMENKEEPSDSMKENKKPMSFANISDIIEQVVRGVDEDIKKNENPVHVHNNVEKPSAIPSSDGDNSRDADEQKKYDTEVVKLPENLPSDIVEIIDTIKDYASKNTGGKVKFFSGHVCEVLLRLERRCKCLGKQSRMRIYEHLAPFVKCRKETLVRRAKNLALEDDERKLQGLLDELKFEIENAMPALRENYERESQRVMQKKCSKENLASEENKQIRLPKRKFFWTEDIKKSLKEVVSLKKRCFLLEGKNKDNLETLLNAYLKTEVQVLWPEGWMSMTALQKVCNNIASTEVKKPSNNNSTSEMTKPPSVTSSEVKKPASTSVKTEPVGVSSTTSSEMKKPASMSIKTAPVDASSTSSSDVKKPASTSIKTAPVSADSELQKLSSNANLSITPLPSTVPVSVNSIVNLDNVKPTTLSKSDITINKIDNKDNVSKTNKPLPDVKTSSAITITATPTSIKTTSERMERIDFIKPNIESEVIVLDDSLNRSVTSQDISCTLNRHDINMVRSENVQLDYNKIRNDNLHEIHKHEINRAKNENVQCKTELNAVRTDNVQSKHDVNKAQSESVQAKHDVVNAPRTESNHCQIIDLTDQMTPDSKKSTALKPKSKFYEGDKGIKCKPVTELESTALKPKSNFYEGDKGIKYKPVSELESAALKPKSKFYEGDKGMKCKPVSESESTAPKPKSKFYEADKGVKCKPVSESDSTALKPKSKFYEGDKGMKCKPVSESDSTALKPKSKFYEGDKGIKCKPVSELMKPKQADKEELTGSMALSNLIADSLSDNLPQNLTKISTSSHSKIHENNSKNYSTAFSSATTPLDFPKLKSSSEGDDIQKVMEDLKALQKLSSPVKICESPTSSPVSVIAFNKNYAPKAAHSAPPPQSSTSLPYRNEYKADLCSGFQEAFQRQLLNDFQLMQNSVNHSTPTSSKSHFNSGDKFPHTSAAYLSEKYYQASNNNYTQQNSSKIKNLPPQQPGSYNILDDMLANFLTEYGYPKTANHIPKPPQK